MQHNHTNAIDAVNQLLNGLQLTSTEQQQLAALEATQEVCRLLQLTQEQYDRFKRSIGIRYLTLLSNHNHYLVSRFLDCDLFWSWWENQWSIRDAEFLNADTGDHNSMQWQQLYAAYNDPGFLTTQIRPTTIIWEAVYGNNKEDRK